MAALAGKFQQGAVSSHTALLPIYIPWSSTIVEQMHGSMAAFHRYHPEYGSDTLCLRTMLSFLNRLLPQASEEERQLAKYEEELAKLGRKEPGRRNAKHEFSAAVVRQAKQEGLPGSAALTGWQQQAMSRSSSCFKHLSMEDKRALETRARVVVGEKHKMVVEEMAMIRSSRDTLLQRMASQPGAVKPVSFSAAAFNNDHLEVFGSRLEEADFQGARLAQLRADARRLPQPTTAEKRARLAEQDVWQRGQPEMPAWAGAVASRRDALRDTAFRIDLPGSPGQLLVFVMFINVSYSSILAHIVFKTYLL